MKIEWNRFLYRLSLSFSLCLSFCFSSVYFSLFFFLFCFCFLMDAAPCHDPTKMLYGARILARRSYIIDSNIKFYRIFSRFGDKNDRFFHPRNILSNGWDRPVNSASVSLIFLNYYLLIERH